MTRPLVIGTRGSRLALWQAEWVAKQLGGEDAGVRLEIIRTRGDRDLDTDLATTTDKGAFTREIELALLERRVDVAVHSLKDLPTTLPEGLVVGAVPGRTDVGDVLLVSPDHVEEGRTLPLTLGCRVGTSSPRRLALLAHALADARAVTPFRGNVPTRVQKCADGQVGAVILARAGLSRLDLDVRPLVAFDLLPERWLPAPGQGALAVQLRADDAAVALRVAALNDEPTALCVGLERDLLARFGAGCHAALGAWARIEHRAVMFSAGALGPDGTWRRVDLHDDAHCNHASLVSRAVDGLGNASPADASGAWYAVARAWAQL